MQGCRNRRDLASAKPETPTQSVCHVIYRGKNADLGQHIPVHLVQLKAARFPADQKARAIGIITTIRQQDQGCFIGADALQFNRPLGCDFGHQELHQYQFGAADRGCRDGEGQILVI